MAPQKINKRTFLKQTAFAAAGLSIIPTVTGQPSRLQSPLMKRKFGKMDLEVTTFGLGGQASIQWTPKDVDPVAIIEKAFSFGVNYFDTSNLYGPSQLNYGKAFNHLSLIPGKAGYNEKLRTNIFLTTKTHLRYAKGGQNMKGINNWTNGEAGSYAIDDLKRSLSQMFGDGKGNYPKGAYVDMVLLHSISNQGDIDAVLEGYENTDPKAENIGALAALLDYRDGTNLTGLNPKEEKLVRHLGFSGHYDTGLMMQLIRRDTKNILDGMLVAINANDKLNFNMQNNVIPVAESKNMGIIGMKTFADGAMYTKPATWSNKDSHVVRSVGGSYISYEDLIQYSLTTPGVDTLIIGIGQISDDPLHCQLTKNITAAQVAPDGMTKAQRLEIEKAAAQVKNGETNYFQTDKKGLTAVNNLQKESVGENEVELSWDTAYAGDNPIQHYEIMKNGKVVSKIKHQPQTSLDKFSFKDKLEPGTKIEYQVVTVDSADQKQVSEKLMA